MIYLKASLYIYTTERELNYAFMDNMEPNSRLQWLIYYTLNSLQAWLSERDEIGQKKEAMREETKIKSTITWDLFKMK